MWIKTQDGALLNMDQLHEVALQDDNEMSLKAGGGVPGGMAWRVRAVYEVGHRVIREFPYADKSTEKAARRDAEALFRAVEAGLQDAGEMIDPREKPRRRAKQS